jgi:uncharacterized membrane protein YkvA (DUF1232 family)
MPKTPQESFDSESMRDLAMFVPRLLKLVWRLIRDAEVPLQEKILLGAAAVYAVGPIDLIPDTIPVLGQLDDLYLITLCLLRLLHRSGEEKIREHWDGPEDIIQVLQSVTDLATRYLPAVVRGHIRNWVEARSGESA